jgi:hypothetical protein
MLPYPARTANNIIIDAHILVANIDPNEFPTDAQVNKGLDILNELLDNFSSNAIYIPITQEVDLITVPGQGVYTVSDQLPADINNPLIVKIEYGTLPYGLINYPIEVINKTQVYHNPRFTGFSARPSYVLLELNDQYSTITLIPTPDIVYTITFRVKQVLSNLQLFDAVTNVPKAAQRFLKYALARELRSMFPSGNWTETNEEEYQELKQRYATSSDIDMQVQTSKLLDRKRGATYFPYWW